MKRTQDTRDRACWEPTRPRRRGGPVPRPESWAVATAAVALLVLGGILSPAAAGDWKGSEETKEGVLHVMNPAQPANGSVTVTPKELWRIGGDTDDENQLFGVIIRVTSDEDGNIYLLDLQLSEVKVFSPDGKYLRTLGREGEGPGEFRVPTDLFFVPGGNIGVLQAAPAKIVLLTKDGEPAGDYPTPQIEGEGFVGLVGARYAEDHLVVMAQVNNFDQEKGTFTQSMILNSVDPQGKEIARYYDESRVWEFSNPVIDETKWDTIQNRWVVGKDGRVYGCTTFDGYQIHVWKPDGSIDRIIECEHTPHKRTLAEMDRVRKVYEVFTRQAPNSEVKIGDHDKDISSLYLRDDGTLWVLNSNGARVGEGTIGIFDVFNPQGRFVKQVTLSGQGDPTNDGYFFVKDRLYVVTDLLAGVIAMRGGSSDTETDGEEPEPMSVICYQIDGSKLEM
jgi:hypothetical protein